MKSRASLPDGGWISYRTSGKNTRRRPALLVVRSPSATPESWSKLCDALAEERRVIDFDPRGTGGSSPAPRGETTRRMAQDVIDLLDHAQIERADVFGLSLGGMLATFLAVDAATRVRKLVLGSTVLRGVDATASGRTRALHIVKSVLSPMVRPEPISRVGLATLALAALRHDARAAAGRVAAPTLLLYGEADTLIGAYARRALERAIPDSKTDVLAGAAHDLALDQPAAMAARVHAFLETRTAKLRPLARGAIRVGQKLVAAT